mmetsp:Transcript_17651/g.52512  ORF Transcript_17651/g.52512 Transcript_17651/m.52512 type:complete len:317 (-) Transcript_17651:671-1621(-)
MFTTHGRPDTSMPRAATSVQIMIFTSPALKASRDSRRSRMLRAPARTQHAYEASLPDSRAPANFRPPVRAESFSRYPWSRSQSRFVRQNTRHWSTFNVSKSLTNRAGFASFTVSDRSSFEGRFMTLFASPRQWGGAPRQASRSPARCTASVVTRNCSFCDCRASSTIVASSGSTGTTRCLTVSGRWDAPLRSTHVGASHTRAARPLTPSACSVAEKKATCSRRSRAPGAAPLGSLSKIFRTVSTSSVSTKRSASSSTKKRAADTSMMPRLTRSHIFRGVPVTTSTSPARHAFSAWRVSTPPMTRRHSRAGSATYFA